MSVTAICETYKISCDGKTPYERRFGMPNGQMIQFGAMVEYHPISAEDFSRQHSSVQHFGKETSRSQTSRNWNVKNSVADGTVRFFGREQRLRTSTLILGSPRQEKNKKFFKESLMNFSCSPTSRGLNAG